MSGSAKKIILLVLSFSLISCTFIVRDDGTIGPYNPQDPYAPGYMSGSAFARELQIEINKVRSDPGAYARDVLTLCLNRYQGYIYTDFEGNRIRTEEGKRAMQKCINVLDFLPSSRILSMEKGLCLATQHFTDDRAHTGDTSGKTSDGKDYDDLMDMYGSAGGSIASIAKYGRTNARDIVVSILVSDGDPARKGRNILLGNKYSKVGISITHGQNAHNGSVMAIYLAERYISN